MNYSCRELTFSQYQRRSRETAIYPGRDAGPDGAPTNRLLALAYVGLGLAGEAGEVAEKIKKIVRDSAGVIGTTNRLAVAKELGDVLWYIAQVATEFGLSFADVAEQNLEKLASRKARGVLGGSGDER
jgi:NTP pyrophosphatase (non-canonical NTP hydrolase)